MNERETEREKNGMSRAERIAQIRENGTINEEKTDVFKTIISSIFDWVEIFAISVTAVIVIFTFFFRLAVVDGSSMNNTLVDGETLLVSRMADIEKGDIIIFQTAYNGYSEPLVKRVIATEGDTVDIDFENWAVYVNGVKLDEDYIKYIEGQPMRNSYEGDTWEYPLTVPEGMLFVMGDNRNDSLDSRTLRIGLVDRDVVMGKVLFRLFPTSKFGSVYN